VRLPCISYLVSRVSRLVLPQVAHTPIEPYTIHHTLIHLYTIHHTPYTTHQVTELADDNKDGKLSLNEVINNADKVGCVQTVQCARSSV
jgi:hypothetical protein